MDFSNFSFKILDLSIYKRTKAKAVSLHAMKALAGRGI
jgi:hypothetical protein